MKTSWLAAWTVFRKELLDALRDRRTLATALLSSVAMGPVLLVLLSALVAQMEERAELREVMVVGIEKAPTLRNYLQRQTYTIRPAPSDYEEQLRTSRLADPVLVPDKDFEESLAHGEPAGLELVSSTANQRAQASLGRLSRLLQGFMSEQAGLRLVSRGVAPSTLEVVQVNERDLASPQARASQITGMLPFFVLMAVLYGALNAALDTTAGERERGSLEPLLTNPAARGALVLGKWGAVASVGMLIAVLSCFSFLPGQWLLRSESLAAMFRFGPREAAWFLWLLMPLAAALSALMMAVAIRCRSVKEAQANNTVVLLAASMLPVMTLFDGGGERPWHLWVPALAQSTLMNRVLKGEMVGWADVLIPLVVCAVLTGLCLRFVAGRLEKVVGG